MHNVPKFCLISGLVAALAGAILLPSHVYRIKCGLCGKTGWHWFRYEPSEEVLLEFLVRKHIDPMGNGYASVARGGGDPGLGVRCP